MTKQIMHELDEMNEKTERVTNMALAIGARLEGKTKVPTIEETLNNPEFKEWYKKTYEKENH